MQMQLVVSLKAQGNRVLESHILQAKKNRLKNEDLIINRVFPSELSQKNPNFAKVVINLLTELELEGVNIINGALATKADLSKFFSAKKLYEAGVPTPETLL
ncbi:hypothetical protein D6783_04520, partial [Candidatus Woesearchaeota archaeon]